MDDAKLLRLALVGIFALLFYLLATTSFAFAYNVTSAEEEALETISGPGGGDT